MYVRWAHRIEVFKVSTNMILYLVVVCLRYTSMVHRRSCLPIIRVPVIRFEQFIVQHWTNFRAILTCLNGAWFFIWVYLNPTWNHFLMKFLFLVEIYFKFSWFGRFFGSMLDAWNKLICCFHKIWRKEHANLVHHRSPRHGCSIGEVRLFKVNKFLNDCSLAIKMKILFIAFLFHVEIWYPEHYREKCRL